MMDLSAGIIIILLSIDQWMVYRKITLQPFVKTVIIIYGLGLIKVSVDFPMGIGQVLLQMMV